MKTYGLMVLALWYCFSYPFPTWRKMNIVLMNHQWRLKFHFCVLLMEKIIILLLVYLIIVITKNALTDVGIQIHPT